MAEIEKKQYLDENGLKTVFSLICQNHYKKDEADEYFQEKGDYALKSEIPTMPNFKTINGETITGNGNITIDLELYEVASSLPTENIKTNKIYLIKAAEEGEQNVYIEYGYINNKWEKLGELHTTINLDDYVTKEELENELYEEDIDANGYDYVDMGEAGIWATCNVGASKPEEVGLYFKWGDTEGCDINSYTAAYKWGGSVYDSIQPTKYNNTDNKGILELEDDAANVNMNGSWRMPSAVECNVLWDLCDKSWETDYNSTGVEGVLFTLKTDPSKQLFFPKSGYIYTNKTLTDPKKVDIFTSRRSGSWSAYIFSLESYNTNGVARYTNAEVYRNCAVPVRAILDTTRSPKYLTKKGAKEIYLTKEEAESTYLKEHQPLKTINGESLVGEGDITITSGIETPSLTNDEIESLFNDVFK